MQAEGGHRTDAGGFRHPEPKHKPARGGRDVIDGGGEPPRLSQRQHTRRVSINSAREHSTKDGFLPSTFCSTHTPRQPGDKIESATWVPTICHKNDDRVVSLSLLCTCRGPPECLDVPRSSTATIWTPPYDRRSLDPAALASPVLRTRMRNFLLLLHRREEEEEVEVFQRHSAHRAEVVLLFLLGG